MQTRNDWSLFLNFFVLCLTPQIHGAVHRRSEDTQLSSLLENGLQPHISKPDFNLDKPSTEIEMIEPVGNKKDPVFTKCNSYKPRVLEGQAIGTFVIQVNATSEDSVRYTLAKPGSFRIEGDTGILRTNKVFERDGASAEKAIDVNVVATDKHGKKGYCDLTVVIDDINDNAPVFEKKTYHCEAEEDIDLNKPFCRVTATDLDSSETITYEIVKETNEHNVFAITSTTGDISATKNLDYESKTLYLLEVRAWDNNRTNSGTARVEISILNVNDFVPVFANSTYYLSMNENEEAQCIVQVKAYDPDIGNKDVEQNMTYFLEEEVEKEGIFSVDKKNGCLSVKKLDHDKPNGQPVHRLRVFAADHWGESVSKLAGVNVYISLNDVNDNTPFIDMDPIHWMENKPKGEIAKIIITDYDTEKVNGGGFYLEILNRTSSDIGSKFKVTDRDNDGEYYLNALVKFDREEKNEYVIALKVEDKGDKPMSGISYIVVIIDDENEFPMKPGLSEFVVYIYEDAPADVDIEVGRMYVEDDDDWVPGEKSYALQTSDPYFNINASTGMVTMTTRTRNGTYSLQVKVKEGQESVICTGDIAVTLISKEAVKNSGSLQLSGIRIEDFILPNAVTSKSKREILQETISEILGVKKQNVDVFTIQRSSAATLSASVLELRFSAHGSPFYRPEKLDGLIRQNKKQVEEAVGLTVLMTNIDECLFEEKIPCEMGCVNNFSVLDKPAIISNSKFSFVGINTKTEPFCACGLPSVHVEDTICGPDSCLNGGACDSSTGMVICECEGENTGPHCEGLTVGFAGSGWAWYPPLAVCRVVHLSMEFKTALPDGLLLYAGPLSVLPTAMITDFLALELREGKPYLLMDYGSGTLELKLDTKDSLANDEWHKIELKWTNDSVTLEVEGCQTPPCRTEGIVPPGSNFLNVNSPLQVGGVSIEDLRQLANQMNWSKVPKGLGFSGCIKKLTYNDEIYDLGHWSYSRNTVSDCVSLMMQTTGISHTTTYLIVSFLCLAVLILVVLAIVAYWKRRREEEPDFIDDIREKIIVYKEEGGYEGDNYDYDINILRVTMDGQPYMGHSNENCIPEKSAFENELNAMRDQPDITKFMNESKCVADNDEHCVPHDEFLLYEYEGTGNSSGSLSSLASGTDDNDMNFDYLKNYGPQFWKLSSIYRSDSSEDSEE